MMVTPVMPEIAIITAMTADRVIGLHNQLPWKISAELQYFKKMTLGKVMIMGKNTFMSLNMRPLPGRQTIVLSQSLQQVPANVELAVNSAQALALAAQHPGNEIMIVGGSSVYQQFLPLATKLYISIIHAQYAGDSYFPRINWSEWSLLEETVYQDFTAKVLQRR